MADELAVAALVRKRAAHARAELDGLLAGLAALDVALRLFDPGIRVEAIRAKAFRPPSDGPGIATRDAGRAGRAAGGRGAAHGAGGRGAAAAGGR